MTTDSTVPDEIEAVFRLNCSYAAAPHWAPIVALAPLLLALPAYDTSW